MLTPSVGPLGRVVSPAEVQPVELSQTFAVGESLLGTVMRLVPHSGVLVNFNGQSVLLPPGQPFVPGQTLTATVAQVSPTLMLQLTDDVALPAPTTATLLVAPTPQTEPQGVLTAAQLKEYVSASQPFDQTVKMLDDLLANQPLLHERVPELTQALRDTLMVLRPQGEEPPDAMQLRAQVDRSGINYESKVQRLLTAAPTSTTVELLDVMPLQAQVDRPGINDESKGQRLLTAAPPGTAAELTKDLKGQLLELSHRLESLAHTHTDTRSKEAATVLEQVKRAVNALELQQLSNQFAPQEHQPLVLPVVYPFMSPTQTMPLTIRRDGGQGGRPSAQPERYTLAMSLDLTALGPLHIEAVVYGAEVSATLQVEDPTVAEFLRAAIPDLVAQLLALELQAHITCDVQEHVTRDAAEPLPHALTKTMRLLDVKI